jgi:NAD(P)-dependent dehydrogenase (short-subunit alcohol dehydrogenase family)
MDLNGRIALVTGGGGGIGAGIGAALAEKGARVILADIDPGRAETEAATIGGGTTAIAIDVTSPDSWASVRSAIEASHGPLDILCNNAGIASPPALLDETDPAVFARVLAVNVTGVYHGIAAFAPGMRARQSGHIVNTSSVNGLLAHGGFGAYSASKFAVTGMSDALRMELAPFGVGVSTLYPGLTRSYMSLSPDAAAQMDAAMRENMEARMMDPLWLGRAVARAVETNSHHIITHPGHKDELVRRQGELLAAFGEPAQPGYVG